MAKISIIKPYKFVNPSSISVKGGGATIIAGGKTITGGMTPQVKSARVTMLAINRIGMAMEGLGKTQQQIRDIIVYENKYLAQSSAFKKKREGYRRDQKSEAQSESFGKKEQEGVAKEVEKKEKKKLGWLEKIFGPFAGIIAFVGRVVITQTVLRWVGDPKNTDKLTVFVKSFSKVFKWAFNIAYKSTDAVLTGFAKVFGSSDKKGLDRFGEVLGGLGQLLIGIAGFKALGYLLNPFSLVNDIIGLIDIVQGQGGGKPGPAGKPEAAKPRAAVQKVAENYGDDAARYYDDLIKRGKKPGDALKAVRGRFKKIPPKPKGIFDKVGDTFGNIKKGLGKGFEKIKGFAGNITKGMRDKLVKSGEFLKSSTQKAMQPIAKKAYEFLESKGIIKLANNAGEKAVGIIKKMPGFSKIMSKVQKEGGEAVLKKLGAKSIPVIGGLVNLYFAYDRFKNGDKSGAALEAISGILDIAGLFTGGSTSALSMVLDTYLFGRDFFPDLVKSENAAFGKLINSILGPINSIKDNLPKVPFLKDGGIVTKPTRAMLGEAGPEVVLPIGQLGGGGAFASTLIGATQSALSRMGAAGEVAKALIGGDLAAAQNLFGVTPVGGGGGDSLGKSVKKASVGIGEIDAGSDISIYLGSDNVIIKDRKEGGNKAITLRGQLANVLSALIWVSKKNFSTGSGGPSPARPGAGGDTSGDFTGSANAEKAFNYLKSKGLTAEQAAGLVGNFMQEAGQNIDPKITNSIGHKGIAQWDPNDRWPKLVNFAKSKSLNPESLEAQLQFVWHELDTGSGGLSLTTLKSAKTVQSAAHVFVTMYERSGEKPGHAGYDNRIKYGNQVYSKYAKMASGGAVTEFNRRNTPKQQQSILTAAYKEARQPSETWSKFASGGKFSNGQLPENELVSIGSGHKLHKTVASQFKAMMEAAKRDGYPLGSAFKINSSYRSYQRQKELYASLGPGTAAFPGTSNHGLGLAVDLWYTDNAYKWLKKNASVFGFRQIPGYETNNPNGHEAWHWENVSGKGSIDGGSPTSPAGGGNQQQQNEPPESMETLMAKLKAAVGGLNTSLGYTSPADTSVAGKSEPGKTPPAPNTPAPSTPKPVAPAATAAASATGKQMTDVSDQVARLEEAAKDAGNYGQIVPLPINSGTTQIAYGGGTQVYTPKTPITYGI